VEGKYVEKDCNHTRTCTANEVNEAGNVQI